MSHNPYRHVEDAMVRGPVTLASKLNKAQQFWNEQAEWSEATFGPSSERGPIGPLKHLQKEAKEAEVEAGFVQHYKYDSQDGNIADNLVLSRAEKELKVEIADCLFLTFDAARRAGMTLDELLDTAFHKLEVNKSRKWQKPTSDGPVEHVRE